MIRKVLPLVSVGLFFVTACTGGSNATPPPPTANPELAMREVTEPWKSMNLPIDGAVVLASSDDAMTVRFVAIAPEEFARSHAALRQSLADRSWTPQDSDAGAVKMSFFERDGQKLMLTTETREGRPASLLSKI